jgi:hypothetical protein
VSELKPCPFCGGPPKIEKRFRDDTHTVFCPKCVAFYEQSEEAVAALWNARTDDAELARLRGEVARLVAAWPCDSRGTVGTCPAGFVVRGRISTVYPTREAAVRAAAGLDAGGDSAKGAPVSE